MRTRSPSSKVASYVAAIPAALMRPLSVGAFAALSFVSAIAGVSGALCVIVGCFEQAPSASRIKPVCRLRQVLNISFTAAADCDFH
jgi:hypothetical protein